VQLLPNDPNTSKSIADPPPTNIDNASRQIRGETITQTQHTDIKKFIISSDPSIQDLRLAGLQLTHGEAISQPGKVNWTQEGMLLFDGKIVVPDFDDL